MNMSRLQSQVTLLKDQGYDMSAIQAAIDSGNQEAATALFRQFMEEHRGLLPPSGNETRPLLPSQIL
jgi:hypothetical protein